MQHLIFISSEQHLPSTRGLAAAASSVYYYYSRWEQQQEEKERLRVCSDMVPGQVAVSGAADRIKLKTMMKMIRSELIPDRRWKSNAELIHLLLMLHLPPPTYSQL